MQMPFLLTAAALLVGFLYYLRWVQPILGKRLAEGWLTESNDEDANGGRTLGSHVESQ
ncbi:hypothetical protein ACFPYJ_28265 [Paenibacillus solisilvae]|uniref:Uncharacterized protein n=1 Tax=Paenibacillus solisilvae TaxID=2486751 RepID=A0ABW0W3Z7_9BACL